MSRSPTPEEIEALTRNVPSVTVVTNNRRNPLGSALGAAGQLGKTFDLGDLWSNYTGAAGQLLKETSPINAGGLVGSTLRNVGTHMAGMTVPGIISSLVGGHASTSGPSALQRFNPISSQPVQSPAAPLLPEQTADTLEQGRQRRLYGIRESLVGAERNLERNLKNSLAASGRTYGSDLNVGLRKMRENLATAGLQAGQATEADLTKAIVAIQEAQKERENALMIARIQAEAARAAAREQARAASEGGMWSGLGSLLGGALPLLPLLL